jgi:catechol 2,3-dioxygenase-like lactoylglutathione lyase family enzyme
MIKTSGIDHIVLTVKDVQKSKEFYTKVCGMKLIIDKKHYFAVTDGTFTLFVGLARDYIPKEQKFDRNNIGLDHWAFKVNTLRELQEIEKTLKDMNMQMEEGGITDDDFGGTAIFTQDPDGMKVEFHLKQ